jgi:hypothetical protein
MRRARAGRPPRPRPGGAAVLILAPLLAALACAKGGGGSSASSASSAAAPPAHVAGTPHTDEVIDAIKSAGLRAEGFAMVQPIPFGAVTCAQGRVEGIDTLVCEFADDAGLDQGKRLVQDQWGREGVQTGVATAAKHTLLGVADRGHHDPNGKTISRILAAFKKI